MQIILSPDLETFVDDLVRGGDFPTASEVVREALRLMKERDALRVLRLQRLRAEVQVGLDQLDRGEGRPLDMEAIKAEARRRHQHLNGEKP